MIEKELEVVNHYRGLYGHLCLELQGNRHLTRVPKAVFWKIDNGSRIRVKYFAGRKGKPDDVGSVPEYISAYEILEVKPKGSGKYKTLMRFLGAPPSNINDKE